jgi:hypothetical protein
MTPTELYDLLDKVGVEYAIVEIFEGVRILSIEVNDEEYEYEDGDKEVPDGSSPT